MDVVYAVKEQPVDEELAYSLRSLQNLPHDKVVMVGGLPGNIDKSKVTYIHNRQTSKIKYKNTTLNLLRACQDPSISDDFIWMNDDFFILKPVRDPYQELNLARGPIEEVIKRALTRSIKLSNYLNSLKEADRFLKEQLHIQTPISYELHTPMILNKQKVLEMYKIPLVKDTPCMDVAKRSLYGNLYCTNAPFMADVKILAATPFTVRELETRTFLSTSDKGWARVKPYLQRKFALKSPYEV